MAGHIITAAALLGAIVAILAYYNKAYNWVHHQAEQDKRMDTIEADIENSKEERTLVVYALSACLDGLQQLGANHTVPKARDKIDKYINQQAHK